MTDSNSTALAAGLVSGYLLGRGGKAKLALGVATFLASRKLRSAFQDRGPQETEGAGEAEGAEGPAGGSALGRLARQVRGELLTAGRSAFTATANRQMNALTEAIEERTRALQGGGAGARAEHEEHEEHEEDEDSGEPEERDEPEEREGREPPEGGRRTAGHRAGRAREGEAAARARRRTKATRPSPTARRTTPSTRRDGGRGEEDRDRGSRTAGTARKPAEGRATGAKTGTRRTSAKDSAGRTSSGTRGRRSE